MFPLILAAALAAETPSPAAAGRDETLLCMAHAVPELDDRVSDAATVAAAVGERCAATVPAWFNANLATRGLGPASSADIRTLSRRMALEAVLTLRKGATKPTTN